MAASCQRCGKCCTSFVVCATPFDVARITKATNKKPKSFVSLISEPPERERTEPSILIDGGPCLLVLKRRKGSVCIFYNGTGCGIYDCRPMLCRTYPFRVRRPVFRAQSRAPCLTDMKSRACSERWVPEGAEKKQCARDCRKYESEIRKYEKIAGEWNKKAGSGGSFRSFLDFALAKALPPRRRLCCKSI
jgi:Fe-S-cluster containining protein